MAFSWFSYSSLHWNVSEIDVQGWIFGILAIESLLGFLPFCHSEKNSLEFHTLNRKIRGILYRINLVLGHSFKPRLIRTKSSRKVEPLVFLIWSSVHYFLNIITVLFQPKILVSVFECLLKANALRLSLLKLGWKLRFILVEAFSVDSFCFPELWFETESAFSGVCC